MTIWHSTTWTKFFPCVEYAHNSLPLAWVPSAQSFIHHCKRMWLQARNRLLIQEADRHGTKAPRYHVGDRVTEVMLATRDIPLKTRSCKLTSCFIGPFTITKIVNPCAVQLLLPSSKRRIHHTSKHYTILYTIKRI